MEGKVMRNWEKFLALLSRILISHIFLFSGVNKIIHFTQTQQYMAQFGMPATAIFGIGAILLELLGGISLLIGYRGRTGALLLIIFLIPTTLIFHTDLSDRLQLIMFMKNLAILGGLLGIAARGTGPFSLDSVK
jgi:putative oxidoreductase